MSRRPLLTCRAIALTAAIFLPAVVGLMLADDAKVGNGAIGRIVEVPASIAKINERAKRGWHTMRRDDYESLKATAADPTRRDGSAWLKQAEYSAAFDAGNLVDGQLRATVARSGGSQPELLALDPLNIGLSDVDWTDGTPAIWGVAPDRRTLIWTDGAHQEFRGRWSLKGRQFSRGYWFDVKLAPAAVSRIRLRLPEGWIVSPSVGDVTAPAPANPPGGTEWQVELGSETSCRLNLIRVAEDSARRSLVFVNTDVSHVLRADGLQTQALFDVEVLEGSENRFVFQLAPEFRVYSVTYGRDEPVPWSSEFVDGVQQLTVELPDALRGHGRPIRIGGNSQRPADDRWVLPTPRLLHSTLISGKLQLRIESPLELQSFEKIYGYKHDATIAGPSQGHSYAFIRNRDDAEMIVRTGRARLDLDAHVVNHFDTTKQTWILTSEIEWVARSGSTFSTTCTLPPGWENIRVSPRSADERSQISRSEIVRSPDGSRTLVIEFKDALTPEHLKTVRVVCERTTTGNQQLAAIPILQPRECGIVDSVLIVSHDSKVTPLFNTTDAVERIDDAGLPPYASNSELWKEMSGSIANRLIVVVKSVSAGQTTLTLEDTEPDFQADVVTTLNIQANDFRETFAATITPKTAPVKRVIAYLSQAGLEPAWQVFSEPESQVAASRISASRHSEWNLPPQGELWELRLSRQQDRPFRILASRNSVVSTNPAVGLLFFPAADEFHGRLELQVANDLQIDVTSANLQATSDEESQATGPANEPTSAHQAWLYENPAASLAVRVESSATVDSNLWAAVHLQSVIANGGHDGDLHRAMYSVTTSSSTAPLQFRIPAPAQVLSLTVNGKVLTPSQDENGRIVVTLAGARQNLVEIRYETPSSNGLYFNRHAVPLPECSCQVLTCEWELALPPDRRLKGTRETILFRDDASTVPWTQRFFGPLGRSAGEEIFSPFSAESWHRLFSAFDDDGAVAPPTNSGSGIPAGYAVVRGRMPGSQTQLTFDTWSAFRASCLGWMVLVSFAAFAMGLRGRWPNQFARPMIAWLSVVVLVAAAMPGAWTELSGAAVAGTLIGMLLPKLAFGRKKVEVPRRGSLALGSTATFGHGTLSARILILAAALAAAYSSIGRNVDGDEPDQVALSPEELEVLVPVESGASNGKNSSLVYLSDRLIARLKAAANHVRHEASYLISTADYRGKVDSQSYVTLEAKYRIIVLSADPSTRVLLPISNANLGGEGACLIDGVPRPVFLAANGTGYEIDLVRSDDGPVVAPKPKRASDSHTSQFAQSQPQIFDVVLRLRPTTTSIAGGAQLNIRVATAASSRVFFEFEKLYPSVVVAGDAGEVVTHQSGNSIESQLGTTGHLDVAWSTSMRQAVSPTSLEASVSCLVEAHPAWLAYRYHVDYRVQSGKADFLHWQIPTRAIVRSVESNSISLNFFHERASGDSQLLIDLTTPQTGEFSVDAYLVVPIDSVGSEFQVPAPELIGRPEAVKVLLNQIGVTAPPEFLLTAKTVESNDIARISGESFASAARFGSSNVKAPLYAYRLQAASVLTFDLSPEPTLRKVRQSQTGRISGRDVEWDFSADVEVTGQAAFAHTLSVDPTLRVESISVTEDKANRLVHWSRVDDKVHLFLSDETTGTQRILLHGRAPLRTPATIPLPLVRVDDARIVDSSLNLTRDKEISTELVDAAALEPIDTSGANRTSTSVDNLVGQYRVKLDGPRPRIKVVRISDHVRVDTATLISRRANGSCGLTIVLSFRGTLSPSPIRVNVPADLASNYQLRLNNADEKSEKRDGGSIDLLITPRSGNASEVMAILTAELTPPAGTWALPRVTVIDADAGANYLLIAAADGYVPEGNSAASLVPETLPAWVRDALLFEGDAARWNAYTADAAQWTLKKGNSPSARGELRVPLFLTDCWWEQNGSMGGLTQVFAVASMSGELVFHCPRNVGVQAVCIDGRSVPVDARDSRQLKLHLDAAPQSHVVVIKWTRSTTGPIPEFGFAETAIPRLNDISVERDILTMVPPAERTLVARKGATHLETLSDWMSRLEGLVAVMWDSTSDEAVQPVLWELVLSTRDICVEQLRETRAAQDRDAKSAELRRRFQRVEEEIKKLQGSYGSSAKGRKNAPANDPEKRLGVLDPAASSQQNLTYEVTNTSSVDDELSFLVVNDQWIAIALCGFGLLVVPLCLLKFIRPRWVNWLGRPAAAWVLLGLVWWLCLAPSAAGLLALGIATYFWLSGLRRPSAAAIA